jgi:diguanylate cyclase (GGDEF)-like protein
MTRARSVLRDSQLGLIAGFAAMLMLMSVLAVVSLVQVQESHEQLAYIADDHMVKMRLSENLQFFARERTVLLQRALLSPDPFERDALWMEYKARAGDFIAAQAELREHPLSPEEEELLAQQSARAAVAMPLLDRVMELILDERPLEAEPLLVNVALPSQDRVIESLIEMRNQARDSAEAAAERASVLQTRARGLLLAMALTVLIAGAIVSGAVVRRVRLAAREQGHLASHDALTNLPNRALILDRLGHAIAHADRAEHQVGVMFLDLDHFKTINDTLGHGQGDRLLRSVAEQLQQAVRASDTVGRIGGDEFVVVLDQLDSAEDAARVADKIIAGIAPQVAVLGRGLHSSTSIGIALYPLDGKEPIELLERADAAMYHAKEDGRGRYAFYRGGMGDRVLRRLNYESCLRQAVDNGELDLQYQPILRLSDQTWVGVEAMLRWRDERLAPIATEELANTLEEIGLMHEVGHWVLDRACAQAREWIDTGRLDADFRVGVNVSPRQFAEGAFVLGVEQALDRHGLRHDQLELEIAEDALLRDASEAQEEIRALRELGVGLAIDHFGSGYSSLRQICELPIDRLKLHPAFVQGMDAGRTERRLVQSLVVMGRGLGLPCVADGVQNNRQLERLRYFGCAEAQGPLFLDAVTGPLLTERLLAPQPLREPSPLRA